jgi:bifunctional non-homologous end joining protein LigD
MAGAHRRRRGRLGPNVTLRAGRRSIRVSNPDKVLFPPDGITKADLATYYREVADAALPYLRGRPLHMHRYPDGLDREGWVHKEVPKHFPEWIETVEVSKQNGSVRQVVCNDAATLTYLADQATITPHVWLSRIDRIQNPDLLVLDLDPPGDEFGLVRHAARSLRELLGEVGLPAYVKTTGSRGVHLAVPLDRRAPFDEVRRLARDLARVTVARDPKRLSIEMRKDKRGGRLFVDWLRNSYAQTFAPPYAVRGLPGAPVSTPIDWDELGRIEARSYTLANIPRRLARKGDPWRGLWRGARGLRVARQRLDDLLGDFSG